MHNLSTVIASLILNIFFKFNVIDATDICNIAVSTLYRWIHFNGFLILFLIMIDISNIRTTNSHVHKGLKSHSKITPEYEVYIVTYGLKKSI